MDKLQKLVLSATALVCTSVISAAILVRPESKKSDQATATVTSLIFDADAVEGTPDISDVAPYYSTMELPVSDGRCSVSLNAEPELNGDKLDVWFTNSAESTVGLKLVVYDESDNVIGQSGIIKSGEYVRSVALKEKEPIGTQLSVKILTYEEETFYSKGSAWATVKVA